MGNLIKLFSEDHRTLNKTVTLPLIGDVKFDDSNSIDVDEDIVEEFISLDFGFSVVRKEQFEKDSEEELMLKGLDEKEIYKLIKDYPKEETKKLKSKEMRISYLLAKMKDSDK